MPAFCTGLPSAVKGGDHLIVSPPEGGGDPSGALVAATGALSIVLLAWKTCTVGPLLPNIST